MAKDITIRTTDEERPWSDKYEAVQYLTKVFSKLYSPGATQGEMRTTRIVSSDIVLAKLDIQQREFIIENTKLAFALRRQIPDPIVGQRMFHTMMVHSIMLCLTHRNIAENEIYKVIRSIGEEQPMHDEAVEKPPRTTSIAGELMGGVKRTFGIGGKQDD